MWGLTRPQTFVPIAHLFSDAATPIQLDTLREASYISEQYLGKKKMYKF